MYKVYREIMNGKNGVQGQEAKTDIENCPTSLKTWFLNSRIHVTMEGEQRAGKCSSEHEWKQDKMDLSHLSTTSSSH